jgi:hypothetical protein
MIGRLLVANECHRRIPNLEQDDAVRWSCWGRFSAISGDQHALERCVVPASTADLNKGPDNVSYHVRQK